MKSSTNRESMGSGFVQILEGIFKVKSITSINSSNIKDKRNPIKKNELDYFEYTYCSDSLS